MKGGYIMKVFINPGHDLDGILDPGAVNPVTGDRECDIARQAGHLLAGYLQTAGIEVKALQSDDLGKVCAMSNNWDADVFVSLHCNAFNGNAKGTETLYKSANGRVLADCIQKQIINSVETVDRGIKQRDRLWVLNGTNAVAVLVEMAFIDNMDDLKFLLKDNLDTVVRAIARGITDYQLLMV